MKWLFFVSAAILLFSIFFHNIIEFDQDLGRHLLTGKIILETQQVPKINLFSYTQPNFPFINSHWLSEVVFYSISNALGIVSLLYLKVAVMFTAFLLTVYTAYKFSKSLVAVAIAFAVFAPVLLERTEIRPEIFSYLFIAIFVYVILLKPKLLWVLSIIEVFWVNTHIYFILGPILVLFYCLSTKRFTLSALLVFVVTLLSPNSLAGALYPLQVFNNYGYSIVENQNIFFLREVVFNPNIFYFGLAVVAFVLSLILSFKKLNVLIILYSLFIILPVVHIRSFPLLFLIELPVFSLVLKEVFFQRRLLLKSASLSVALVIVLTLFRSYRLASNQYYLSIGSRKQFGSEISESGKGAVDFVLANQLRGPIFNNFDIGSYLDYRLYPAHRVFVDGRPEAYSVAFFQNLYIPMQQTPENFAKVDDVYKFNLIVFSHTDATPWAQTFLRDTIKNKDFEMVYLDNYAVVLVRRGTFPPSVKNINQPKTQTANGDVNSLILF